jgi:hypothetical protein
MCFVFVPCVCSLVVCCVTALMLLLLQDVVRMQSLLDAAATISPPVLTAVLRMAPGKQSYHHIASVC